MRSFSLGLQTLRSTVIHKPLLLSPFLPLVLSLTLILSRLGCTAESPTKHAINLIMSLDPNTDAPQQKCLPCSIVDNPEHEGGCRSPSHPVRHESLTNLYPRRGRPTSAQAPPQRYKVGPVQVLKTILSSSCTFSHPIHVWLCQVF